MHLFISTIHGRLQIVSRLPCLSPLVSQQSRPRMLWIRWKLHSFISSEAFTKTRFVEQMSSFNQLKLFTRPNQDN